MTTYVAVPGKVYVVFGQSGEYSDRTEWAVCAFPTEQAAADLVLALTSAANALAGNYFERYEERREVMAAAGDPHFSEVLGDPTRYSYAEIELRESAAAPAAGVKGGR